MNADVIYRQISSEIDAAAAEASSNLDLGSRLLAVRPNFHDPVVWPFNYHLLTGTDSLAASEPFPYYPLWVQGHRVFPVWVEEVTSDIADLWAQLASRVTHPLALSRLSDLLSLIRYGSDPDAYTRQAVLSLLDAAELLFARRFRIEAVRLNQRAAAVAVSLVCPAVSGSLPPDPAELFRPAELSFADQVLAASSEMMAKLAAEGLTPEDPAVAALVWSSEQVSALLAHPTGPHTSPPPHLLD